MEKIIFLVGAGSAGCVLAARLSQFHTVLLIEAGDEFSWTSRIPLAAPFIQATDNDWQFRTVPQNQSSYGLVNKVSFWPRGKGPGGSGQMNYLVHYTGIQDDWNDIPGWNFPVMSQYMAKLRGKPYRTEIFQKTENLMCMENTAVNCSTKTCQINKTKLFLNIDEKCPPTLHGSLSRAVHRGKPLIFVQKEKRDKIPILKALFDAGQELKHLGLKIAASESTIRKGQRWSSYDSHLLPAMKWNSRLHVLLNHQVTKIQFEGRNAKGVVVDRQYVAARKEIILSAGAVGTPQLLQLSGIGPSKLLSKHKIVVVADLPVGLNLSDHLNVPLYISIEKPVSLTINKILRIGQVFKYLLFGKGPFGQSAVTGIVRANDLGLLFFGMGTTEEKLFRAISNYDSSVFDAMFPHHRNHSSEGFIIMASCLRPQSRGTIQLDNTDPYRVPLINPNYLSNQQDLICTRKAIELARRLLLTKTFQQLGAKLHLPKLPSCLKPDIRDLDYLECLTRTVGITGYHPVGTAAIGSVLDSNLRVKKTSGLRVVDSSSIPTSLYGAPNSILLTIAERAANLILAQYQ